MRYQVNIIYYNKVDQKWKVHTGPLTIRATLEDANKEAKARMKDYDTLSIALNTARDYYVIEIP